MVLNLIINGLPSILKAKKMEDLLKDVVLNLIINGLPSIHKRQYLFLIYQIVLNLIINGLPSIHYIHKKALKETYKF